MRRIIQEYEDENGDLNIDSELKMYRMQIAFILLLQEQVIMLV